MKQKFKIIALLIIFGILTTGIKSVAEEKTKVYKESWPASSIQTLEIINKFGEIKVINNGGSQVTIDVVVTVEASSASRANDLLGQISVTFGKSGTTAKAETTIDKSFTSRSKFSIDYTVNIPSDKNLKISNKYGNTIINKLNANGDFDIQYGNLTASELNAPGNGSMNISLSYGKSQISSVSDVKVTVKYSTMNFGKMDDLKLTSKYSVINIEEAGSIETESQYDTFNFEEVGSVSATTKYSNIKIEELKKSLKIDAGYGGIRVSEISNDFESVSIVNSYGQIRLGLGSANYSIDATCTYCGILYPSENFSGNKTSEKNVKTVQGKVGKEKGGTVYIKSRYGEIKLNE